VVAIRFPKSKLMATIRQGERTMFCLPVFIPKLNLCPKQHCQGVNWRFGVNWESTPATSAFSGSNSENCVQPTLNERFAMLSAIRQVSPSTSDGKKNLTAYVLTMSRMQLLL
jgi:hypothetical protein